MNQWNDYIKWLKTKTDNEGKPLSGNKKMDNVEFSKSTLVAYNKENPNSKLTYDLVKPIQAQIKKYRDQKIADHKAGKKMGFDFEVAPDYSNFMRWATGTDVDGINGQYTSQFIFPKAYLINLNTNTTHLLGYAKS